MVCELIFIKGVQKRFEDGMIDIATFFNQLTFTGNTGSIQGMDSYSVDDEQDIVESYDDYNEEEAAVGGVLNNVPVNEVVPEEVAQLRNEINELRQANVCIICLINPRNTVMLPCGHVRTCDACSCDPTAVSFMPNSHSKFKPSLFVIFLIILRNYSFL